MKIQTIKVHQVHPFEEIFWKFSEFNANFLKSVEPMTGFEPVASSLPRKRSTPELHRLFDAVNLILFCKS